MNEVLKKGGRMVTGFTNYFRDKWVKVYKEEPSLDSLNKQLDIAIRVQPYLIFFDSKKKDFVKILATYWVPDSNLVFKVDFESRSYVTFYCKDDLIVKSSEI